MVELKADEDTYLPLQGLDYCSPVAAPCAWQVPALRVFSGAGIGKEPPLLLFLVAPALHLHPTTDVCRVTFRHRLSGRSSGLTKEGGMGSAPRSAPVGMTELGMDFRVRKTSPFLFFWPGSQQTAYIHQLCQVIRVVIGYQQGFAQDGLTFSPRNVGM